MNKKSISLLREIPSVDQVIRNLHDLHDQWSHSILVREIRAYLQLLRHKIRLRQIDHIPSGDDIQQEIRKRLLKNVENKVTKALNATGVVLHTGLGRAVLPPQAIRNVLNQLRGYTVLEIDRETGKRSTRDKALRDLLCFLTGAEDATVVNNNAAAVLLVLATLAREKEVIVSRGQLVEIGGSFRIPDVMKESGARLVEVGCTNRTHLADYEKAISERTAALLHVHTSNFKILGFTEEVPLETLSSLAKRKNLYIVQDAGSGAIVDLYPWGNSEEPLIFESIKRGVDIITFSGDKLIGSCQAGIIVGKHALINKLRHHPLARAMRVDKVTLSILEATLKHYLEPETVHEHIPTIKMLLSELQEVKKRAQDIAKNIRARISYCCVDVIRAYAKVGSGAFPIQDLPSYAVSIKFSQLSIPLVAKLLRVNTPPVFGKIQNNSLIIHPRTLLPEEDNEIADIIVQICQSMEKNC